MALTLAIGATPFAAAEDIVSQGRDEVRIITARGRAAELTKN